MRYCCDECSKTFASKGSLQTHARIHTGEKPFSCPAPECKMQCTQQANLSRHIRLIHGNDADLLLRARQDRMRWSQLRKLDLRRHQALQSQDKEFPTPTSLPDNEWFLAYLPDAPLPSDQAFWNV